MGISPRAGTRRTVGRRAVLRASAGRPSRLSRVVRSQQRARVFPWGVGKPALGALVAPACCLGVARRGEHPPPAAAGSRRRWRQMLNAARRALVEVRAIAAADPLPPFVARMSGNLGLLFYSRNDASYQVKVGLMTRLDREHRGLVAGYRAMP